jgi:hypothetical protein
MQPPGACRNLADMNGAVNAIDGDRMRLRVKRGQYSVSTYQASA